MLKQTITILTALLVAILLASAIALVIERYVMPQTAQVSAVAMYLDDQQWTNNTLIVWGVGAQNLVEPGATYVMPFRVNNTCNAPINVTLIVFGLPVGWVETWNMNGTTVAVGTSVVADLTLYVAADATGVAEWNMWVEITEA